MILALIGLTVGLLLGALGGGGSILTVPALVYLADVPLSTATTASLLVVGTSSALGAARGVRAGRVRVRTAATLVALGIPASAAGTVLAGRASDAVVLTVLAIAMVCSATSVLLRGQHATPLRRPRWLVVAAACVVGLLTGFTGAGGGFVVVPVLVGVLGFTLRSATSTSLLVIAANCAVSLVLRSGGGLAPDWSVVLPTAAAAVLGSVLGGKLADRLPARLLSRGFALLLLGLATVLLGQQL